MRGFHFSGVVPPAFGMALLQEGEYAASPGSPGELVALKTTHPVGLAADLTISGVVGLPRQPWQGDVT